MSKGGGTKMATSTSDISPRYQDYVNQSLSLAGQIANMPYIPYEGERIAPFSPDQNAAFNLVRGGQQRFMPMQQTGNATTLAGINSITDPSTMRDNYFNPYDEAVVDSVIEDLGEQRDIANERARLRNPYGGSRAALLEAENEKNYAKQISDATGRLRRQGFLDASQLGQSATGQLLGAAQQATGQAGANLGQNLQYAGALSGIGQQAQGMRQAIDDLRYQDFIDQLNQPLRALNIRLGAAGQTPMGSVQRIPIQRSSGLSGLGSLLSGGAKLASLMSGTPIGLLAPAG